MIAIVVIINTSITLHIYHFFLVIRILKFYSFSLFDDYNTILLSIFTMLCTTCCKFVPLNNMCPIPPFPIPW